MTSEELPEAPERRRVLTGGRWEGWGPCYFCKCGWLTGSEAAQGSGRVPTGLGSVGSPGNSRGSRRPEAEKQETENGRVWGDGPQPWQAGTAISGCSGASQGPAPGGTSALRRTASPRAGTESLQPGFGVGAAFQGFGCAQSADERGLWPRVPSELGGPFPTPPWVGCFLTHLGKSVRPRQKTELPARLTPSSGAEMENLLLSQGQETLGPPGRGVGGHAAVTSSWWAPSLSSFRTEVPGSTRQLSGRLFTRCGHCPA